MQGNKLHTPALGTVSDNQAHYLLRATISRGDFRKTNHVVSQPVSEIRLVGDIGICHKHDVGASDMYRLDGMRDPKVPSIAYVEGPKG